MAEAAKDSKGLETPVEWTLTIKSSMILILIGMMMIITGYSLGEIADDAISWINKYDDNTSLDRSDDTDVTAATYDIAYHMVTAVGGMFMLGIMSISSYIFAWTWLDIKDGNADLECEVTGADYSAITPIF